MKFCLATLASEILVPFPILIRYFNSLNPNPSVLSQLGKCNRSCSSDLKLFRLKTALVCCCFVWLVVWF